MKLHTTERNLVYPNKCLRAAFGVTSTLQMKQCKCCFSCQDSMLRVPSRDTYPNFKIDEVFCHLQCISRYVWLPGMNLSGDEQSMGFTGDMLIKSLSRTMMKEMVSNVTVSQSKDKLSPSCFETKRRQRSILKRDTLWSMQESLHCPTVWWIIIVGFDSTW